MMGAMIRPWANLLLAGVYLAGLGLGALFFIASQRVCGARWSESFRPVPEALTSLLPSASVLVLLAVLARPMLAPWTIAQDGGLNGIWMTYPFLVVRTMIYLGAWLLFARHLLRGRYSTQSGAGVCDVRETRVAAAFLVVFAPTVWLASNDWLMSLTPHWTSTVFGVYMFAGFVCSALAAMLLGCVWLRTRLPERQAVSTNQLRDLAAWLLGFTSLWVYLWYCQYMLIWFTNQPLETEYFVARLTDGWAAAFYATVFLKWVVPFVLLLPRAGKSHAVVLAVAATSVMLGQWLDLYVTIVPGIAPLSPRPGILEAAMAIGLAAAVAWLGRIGGGALREREMLRFDTPGVTDQAAVDRAPGHSGGTAGSPEGCSGPAPRRPARSPESTASRLR